MANDIAELDAASKQRYTSIKGTDFATQKRVFAAITNAESLAEHLGETINLKHVIIQPVTTENEKGEVENFLRTVLISDNDVAYASGSGGIVLAIQTLFDVFGEPDKWAEALPIKVVEERGRRGYRYMTIKVADDTEVEPAK
jgi:hypothetical protein